MSRQIAWLSEGLKGWHFLLAATFFALAYGLGFVARQNDFGSIIGFLVPFFFFYLFIIYRPLSSKQLYFFIGIGILLRCLLLFSLPNLSDDIYRFIWDGRLIVNGINPFDALPGFYMQQGNELPGLSADLFGQLNSPGYFTIYPPVCQAVFASACYLSPDSIFWSSFLMKLVMLAFEIGSITLIIKLLKTFRLKAQNVLIYVMNPLIIIEIMGNLHFEGAMIFFLLLAVWCLVKEHNYLSAVFMALAIASKLLPLIFLPFLIKRLGWQKSLRYFLAVGLLLILLFLPLFSSTFFENFGQSLDLYFRKFEFNASLYYLLRWLGIQLTSYNQIIVLGPALALMVVAGITHRARTEQSANWQNLPHQMLFAICLYLLCATTVHPWYASLPLVLCIFTRYRFPLLWSGLIMLTYINYSYDPYFENLWVVGIEYSFVAGFGYWEWHRKSRIGTQVL